jgi:hypothetical protein
MGRQRGRLRLRQLRTLSSSRSRSARQRISLLAKPFLESVLAGDVDSLKKFAGLRMIGSKSRIDIDKIEVELYPIVFADQKCRSVAVEKLPEV